MKLVHTTDTRVASHQKTRAVNKTKLVDVLEFIPPTQDVFRLDSHQIRKTTLCPVNPATQRSLT